MSYYSEVAFVIGFDSKEQLTAWMCSAMLEVQQNMEWYADDQNSQGFTDQLGLVDVIKTGSYRKYNRNTCDMKQHTFVVESTFNRLPWSIEKQLRELSEMASNMGGGGGYIIIGEEQDDNNVFSTSANGFCISDYFEMVRSVSQTDADYMFDGGELLNNVLTGGK